MTSPGSGGWSWAAGIYTAVLKQEQLERVISWAGLVDWPPGLLLELLAHSYCGVTPRASLMREMSEYSVLMPQGSNPLTVGHLTQLALAKGDPHTVSDNYRSKFMAWFVPPYRFTDTEVLTVWPARTKMDLSLRRTRFRDVWQAYQAQGLLPLLSDVLQNLEAFDYIAVCNISWAAFLLRDQKTTSSWWSIVRLWPCWKDPDTYLAVAKAVNDRVKARTLLDFERGWFTEMGTLLGYRNPPFPGFDIFEQAQDLADGGDVHGMSRTELDPEFVAHLTELDMHPHSGQAFQSFHDYVVSAGWVTSGASSVGRVDWTSGKDSGHFKARKNLVPDVTDLEDLYRRASSSRSQENVTVVKAELGKIRLAVSSDMYTYLMMDWLSSFMTHSYKQWPGSTIEENAVEQTRRQRRMLDDCRADKWCLPFDFSGFDHQPSTDELVAIFRKMEKSCEHVVPAHLLSEYHTIYDRVVASMRNSWLYARDGDRRVKMRVAGGLMSGLRWTSLVGNAWNTVMTGVVFSWLRGLLINTNACSSFIRGDDSALAFPDWSTTLLFRLGYAGINAVGADGKFAIHHGATEFLRTWYSKTGLSGYVMRTIPGLVQRKPWNPQPWVEEGVMDSLYGVVQILRRRSGLPSVEQCWQAIKTVWSRRKHLSQSWLLIPKPRGFGVEPWDGVTVADTRVVDLPPKDVTLASNGFSANQIAADPLSVVYPWSPVALASAGQASMLGKASADDIPALSSIFRANTRYNLSARVRKLRPVSWSATDEGTLANRAWTLAHLDSTAADHDLMRRPVAAQWGMFRSLSHELEYSKLWSQHTGGDGQRLFESRHSDFLAARSLWEARGLRRSEATGWLLGDLAMPKTTRLHPMLAGVLSAQVVSVLASTMWRRRVTRNLGPWMARVSSVLEHALYASKLSQELYNW